MQQEIDIGLPLTRYRTLWWRDYIFVVVQLGISAMPLDKNWRRGSRTEPEIATGISRSSRPRHASVSDGYKCVDLRRFYLPYGLQGEHNIKPTKHGIALRLDDEWSALMDLMPVIYTANPHLLSINPCCDNDDHANQLGMLSCPGCNPFNTIAWNWSDDIIYSNTCIRSVSLVFLWHNKTVYAFFSFSCTFLQITTHSRDQCLLFWATQRAELILQLRKPILVNHTIYKTKFLRRKSSISYPIFRLFMHAGVEVFL